MGQNSSIFAKKSIFRGVYLASVFAEVLGEDRDRGSEARGHQNRGRGLKMGEDLGLGLGEASTSTYSMWNITLGDGDLNSHTKFSGNTVNLLQIELVVLTRERADKKTKFPIS